VYYSTIVVSKILMTNSKLSCYYNHTSKEENVDYINIMFGNYIYYDSNKIGWSWI